MPGCSKTILVAVDAIETECLIHVVAKHRLGSSFQILYRRLLAGEHCPWRHLLIVATDEQRHLGLIALAESLGRLFGQEIAVDVIGRDGFDGGKFHQLLGREGTQVLDVLLANLLG